ncbi:hypothetical protein ADK34_24685 [Streptomyces viridochromogenes]|uniref:Uncharacterized protein n=1 Tax=Streptomyces viridochromogenes TaxID=1938 RepID=A0A0L8K1X0_STRVR|nr:hypothetical protein ADK34_24685 [Streptomyces viridochromogenes]
MRERAVTSVNAGPALDLFVLAARRQHAEAHPATPAGRGFWPSGRVGSEVGRLSGDTGSAPAVTKRDPMILLVRES